MTWLDEIARRRRAAVAEVRALQPLSELRAAAQARNGRRDFLAAIRAARPAVIAEFKRRSPTAGSLAAVADPGEVARAYERGGAAAISVLTEPAYFGGSFDDLRAARAACGLPVLAKDFVVDEYQLWQSAAAGADAVLLIAAIVDDLQLSLFVQRAALLGLVPLVEVHDEAEAARAVRAHATLIGINNRDLRTFAVNPATAIRVRSRLPKQCLSVAESGYATRAEVADCFAAGFDAVLVGEALMRDGDPASAVARLRGARR